MDVPIISVQPKIALVDEEQIITVNGLTKFQHICIYLRTSVESGAQFASLGCYRADQNGIVNVSKDESIQGTYTGVDTMGLFWSMKAEPGYERRRFMKTDVSTPLVYDIFVYRGILTLDEIQHCPKASVAVTSIKRFYKSEHVKRIKLDEDMVVGTLFIPHGKGPFPAVIDMFGGIGGIVETRAALLASRGFLALSLPYTNYTGLPHYSLRFQKYTYFEKNIEWLSNHPLALRCGIGLVGVSAGGYMANHMSFMSNKIKACVLINSPIYYPIRAIYLDPYYQLPMTIENDPSRFVPTSEGIDTSQMYRHYEERVSKSWETSAKYLCILGADDRCLDPFYTENWYSHWPPDQKHRVRILKYQDAGHLIEPPYTPLNRVTFSLALGNYQVWGGSPEGHAYSQKDSWKQILTFLKENISQPHNIKSNL